MNYFEEYLKVSQERDRLRARVTELESDRDNLLCTPQEVKRIAFNQKGYKIHDPCADALNLPRK